MTSRFHEAVSTDCSSSKAGLREIQSGPVEILEPGHPPDAGFLRQGAAAHAVDDPLQHAHVLAEAGPHEPSVCVLPEPVHVEDLGRLAQRALHLDPVPEVIAHVIAAERSHRHRIAADGPHTTDGCRRGLRAHRRADVDPGCPIERLVDERHGRRATAAEHERADRHAIRVVEARVDDGTLGERCTEPRVRVRGWLPRRFPGLRRPHMALPVQTLGRGLVRHALPPHAAIRGEGDVGENRVLLDHRDRVRVGIRRRTGRDAEHSRFGVDRTESSLGVRLDPRDVVADDRDLPVAQPFGRDHHREVGFAARARKCRRDVDLLAARILEAQNQHVLGHPAVVARDVRGDPQPEALLPQQRVSTVSRAVGPDLPSLREVDDVLVVVARPGHILLARR